MRFWKSDINQETYENVYNWLIEGKIKINDLNFNKAIHKRAAFAYIKDKPSYLQELKTENEKEFLRYFIIKNDYKLFAYLKPEQYEEELAKCYLENRLKNDKDTASGFLRKSFDESIVFSMYYDTRNGEQIFYYDKDIETTTFLVSKFEISLKVKSVIQLFKKLDISISMFGYNALFNELMCWINKEYRKTVIKFITTKEVGVYKINALYDDIEKETIKALNNTLADAGIEVQKMSIQKLSISENIAKILEKEGLERFREKIKREAELEYEKQALENYAKKAKIHKDNPDFELTLTEAEKDFALDRYITKQLADNGKLKEAEFKDELSDRKKKTTFSTLQKVKDKPFVQEEKSKGNAFLFIPALVLMLLGIFMFLCKVKAWAGATFLVLGGLFLIGGFIQLHINNKSANKVTPQMKEEYEAKLQEYNKKEQDDK